MAKIGLTEPSEIKEKIVKIDDKTAIRYKLVEERIDLEVLRREKENLEAQLNEKEPSDKELIEQRKMIHPFYAFNPEFAKQRIEEIKKILGE